MSVSIVLEPINIETLRKRALHPQAGAVLIFCGDIRNHSDGRNVDELEYEAHENMALHQMKEIIRVAFERWPLHHAEVIHRLGRMKIMECSIAIAVSTSHRSVAFEASQFIIDTIKFSVPIWKKEYFSDGDSAWSNGSKAGSVVELSYDPPPAEKG